MLKYGVCVSECPSADKATTLKCKETEYIANNADYVGCEYQIGQEFFEEWGIDLVAYTGLPEGTVTTDEKFAYRYNSKPMYGFCVPSFDKTADSVSALGEKAIRTFK